VNVTGRSRTGKYVLVRPSRTMTDVEALSVREAVDWCGRGVTVREITRLRTLHGGLQDGGQEGRVG
jgi:hypothetical protein